MVTVVAAALLLTVEVWPKADRSRCKDVTCQWVAPRASGPCRWVLRAIWSRPMSLSDRRRDRVIAWSVCLSPCCLWSAGTACGVICLPHQGGRECLITPLDRREAGPDYQFVPAHVLLQWTGSHMDAPKITPIKPHNPGFSATHLLRAEQVPPRSLWTFGSVLRNISATHWETKPLMGINLVF